MIYACGCHCGSTEEKARRFLHSAGYRGWDTITIHKGKEASRSLVNRLPDCAEARAFNDFLDNASTWCVIIGEKNGVCRWTDIAHTPARSTVEGKAIVEAFA